MRRDRPGAIRPRVFVTRPLTESVLVRLAAVADLDVWREDFAAPRDELLARSSGVSALLTSVTERIDDEVLERCPELRVVSNIAVGIDNFDLDAITRRGVPAGNTPGVLTEATADIAFGLIIATARRFVEAREALLTGGWTNWSPYSFLGLELAGSTLGIIGTGRIGEAVIRRARGFSMNVVAWSRTPREIDGVTYLGFDEVLSSSDVVSLHVALTSETHHLIGARELSLMKSTAFLINTSRGSVIDQAALTAALLSGSIAGAGLDVYETEPLPVDDPLCAQTNCVLLPHIGSATLVTRQAMIDAAIDNVLAGLRGARLPYCVNPEVYGTF